MTEVRVGRVSSFPDPGRKVVEIGGIEVGIFHLDGKFTAYENRCPHMAGPVCQGKIIPRVEEVIAEDKKSLGMAFSKTQLHVACPWHGYEFDVRTGRHPGNPKLRLRPINVFVSDGDVVVELTTDRAATGKEARHAT